MKLFAKKFGKVLAFLLVACCVFAFAACGGTTADDEGGKEDEFVQVAGSAGLVYSLNEDGESYTFSNLGTCTDSNVVIGNWYNGKPVTGIGEGACRDDEGDFDVVVESITVSEGITDVAFRGLQNWNVKKIILPDSLEVTGMAAFRLNAKLETIVIGSGLKTISSDAFSGIETAFDVYYRGTEAQWNAITDEGGNDILEECTFTYNYTGDGSEL